ncbi:MAG TPA: hypothetical protein VF574_18075 [Allosphingosinicella sp.]|jgi:hypothetical protein
MLEARESQIQELVAEELAATGASGAPNHDIYEARLTAPGGPAPGFDYVPYCIYFYYVRVDNSGKLRIDHYFDCDGPSDDPTQWQPIPYAAVPGRLRNLALNGRRLAPTSPAPLPDHNFDNIVWSRRSYIAFFFDEVNWQFHTRGGGRSAVAFKPRPGAHPNHTFFDAQDVPLVLPNNFTGIDDTRSAIFFVNHMKKNENGNDFPPTPPESQLFEFEMFLKVQFAETSPNTLTVIFDPTGTNQGPPETP